MSGARKCLQQLECPFNWGCPTVTVISIDQYITSLIEKKQTINNENQFHWTRSTLNLILAYEISSKLKDYPRALVFINECESHVRDLQLAGCKEPLFLNIEKQLTNVLKATKAHILIDHGDEVEAQKILSQLQPTAKTITRSIDKAGLLGLKAAMFLYYDTTGHRMALQWAKEACNLDPEEAEWQFIVGNAMGRIRRVENGEINCETEFKQIEKACKLRKDATYIVHLATLYAEYASFLYFNKDPKTGRVEFVQSEMFAERAIEQFMLALALRPDCSSLMARVAHGLVRIRHKKLVHVKLIKTLLNRVVELAPHNCMAYHDLGMYFEKYENNVGKAIANLKKADNLGNIKALTYMISLKWKHRKRAEIIKDILNGLDKYSENEAKAELQTMLGFAYILIENDWGKGVQHLTFSLQVDAGAKYLLNCFGFCGKRTNLLEIMVNEVRKKARTEQNKFKINAFNEFLKECDQLNLKIGPGAMKFQEWANIQEGATVKKRH